MPSQIYPIQSLNTEFTSPAPLAGWIPKKSDFEIMEIYLTDTCKTDIDAEFSADALI